MVVRERVPPDDAMAGASRPAVLIFDIEGMDCADCAKTVERSVGRLDQVASATVSFGSATLAVHPHVGGDLTKVIQDTVDAAGYRAELRQGHVAVRSAPWWRDQRLIGPSLGAVLWLIAFGLSFGDVSSSVPIVLYGASLVAAGRTFVRASLQSVRARRVDMNVLMTIAIVGAVLLGEWSEAALAAVLFAVGSAAQALSLDRTRGAIKDLLVLAPDEATRWRDGREEQVALSEIVPGDLVRVKPGERLAVDGRIVEGRSEIDQSAVTGESMPAAKAAGDDVFAGTLNGPGALVIEATRPASDSTLSRIVNAVEEAQGSRAPTQQVVDRFAAVYTPLVVAGAMLVALVGALWTGDSRTWATRALVLLVVSCPCALIISTPVAIVSAVGSAARRGIVVKGGAALEAVGDLRAVAFDKTGTLTWGRPAVTDVIPRAGCSQGELLRLAAGVEQHSEHPLGRSIVKEAARHELTLPSAREVTAVPGRGIEAIIEGRTIAVGSPSWAASLTSAALQPEIDGLTARLAEQGQTPIFVLVSASRDHDRFELAGVIGVADRMRPDAPAAVQALYASGVEHLALLTGDTAATARAVGQAAGITDIRAEQLPADKLDAVRGLRDTYGNVGMVGDGINDAPAMAAADTAFAMGRGGTDVALDVAQIALLRNDLSAVSGVIKLSRRTTAIIRQNIGLSLVVKAAALVLAVVGIANLWIAVAADVGTSLLVTANALRLLRWTGSGSATGNHHHESTASGVAVPAVPPVTGGSGANGSLNPE